MTARPGTHPLGLAATGGVDGGVDGDPDGVEVQRILLSSIEFPFEFHLGSLFVFTNSRFKKPLKFQGGSGMRDTSRHRQLPCQARQQFGISR